MTNQQTNNPRNGLPEGLNAAQMAEAQRLFAERVANAELRKWCVSQALEVETADVVLLARELFEFITEMPTDHPKEE